MSSQPISGSYSRRTKWDTEEHLRALDDGFKDYLGICNSRRIFSGPSVHFYERTVTMVRKARSLMELADSDAFADCIYATLTAWGMHRMGPGGAKLTEYHAFRATLGSIIRDVDDLAGRSLLDLKDDAGPDLTKRLAGVAARPGITASDAPLVANTKTLHFLLPDLVPPIDRTYTGRFFLGPNTGMQLPGTPEGLFTLMYPRMVEVSRRHSSTVRAFVQKGYMGGGHAKAIDNAIVGYVLTHLPRKARREE